ncbi:MAG: hypothetical protein K9I94_05215 [Bacteroidales bacterium]|nr:hypothetical protein [Bacteroidales bacterium]
MKTYTFKIKNTMRYLPVPGMHGAIVMNLIRRKKMEKLIEFPFLLILSWVALVKEKKTTRQFRQTTLIVYSQQIQRTQKAGGFKSELIHNLSMFV